MNRTFEKTKDRIKRFILAVLPQFFGLCLVLGIIVYVHFYITPWLNQYFNVAVYENEAERLQKKIQFTEQHLSVFNLSGYADYLSAVTGETLASAKVAALKQTVLFLADFFDSLLLILTLFIGISVIFRIRGTLKKQTFENEIAEAVIKKLLPVLTENNRQPPNPSNNRHP